MMTRANPSRLFWDQRGHIACGEHTPFPGTDTWEWDQWSEVPVEALEEWRHMDTGGDRMECETCHKHDERDKE